MAWNSRARSSFSALTRALTASSWRCLDPLLGISRVPFQAPRPGAAAMHSDAGSIPSVGFRQNCASNRHPWISDGTLIHVTPKPILCWFLFLFAAFAVHAQTYPLAISDRALMNPEVLHARNWPSSLGLPPLAITRSNAGERWYGIETARGEFNPNFGNLFTPDTGWVDVAAAQSHRSHLYLQHRARMGRASARQRTGEDRALRHRRREREMRSSAGRSDEPQRELHLEGMDHRPYAEKLRRPGEARSSPPGPMQNPQLRIVE